MYRTFQGDGCCHCQHVLRSFGAACSRGMLDQGQCAGAPRGYAESDKQLQVLLLVAIVGYNRITYGECCCSMRRCETTSHTVIMSGYRWCQCTSQCRCHLVSQDVTWHAVQYAAHCCCHGRPFHTCFHQTRPTPNLFIMPMPAIQNLRLCAVMCLLLLLLQGHAGAATQPAAAAGPLPLPGAAAKDIQQ
jgi:hypothetical protein